LCFIADAARSDGCDQPVLIAVHERFEEHARTSVKWRC
jgi:hypothetical protein